MTSFSAAVGYGPRGCRYQPCSEGDWSLVAGISAGGAMACATLPFEYTLLAPEGRSRSTKMKTLWLLGAFAALGATLGCVPAPPSTPARPPTTDTWTGDAYFQVPKFRKHPALYFVDPVTKVPRQLRCGCKGICSWSRDVQLWGHPQKSEIVALDYGKDFTPRALSIRNVVSGVSIEFLVCHT